MSGNASNELNQSAEFLASLVKAGSLVVPGMTKEARQGWIGLPPQPFAQVLREMVFFPSIDISLVSSNPWITDTDGNIHFTVTSNGMTREEWKTHLERRNYRFSNYSRDVLSRASDAPTNGVIYHIVVRPGKEIDESNRITRKIRAAAQKKGWRIPHWEVACLIRDTFSDEQLALMGLWYIVTMHKPIEDSDGDPFLLYSDRGDDGCGFDASPDRPGYSWSGIGGFAFVLSQISSKISDA